jgi:NAD(P)-dependent dehydrogenase (short-subunit alcohol dehydrogenase family)
VNAICPGVIETDMTRAGFAIDGDADAGILRQHDAYPLRRIGTPEQAAATILFLASPQADFINGVALPMEGGATVGKW